MKKLIVLFLLILSFGFTTDKMVKVKLSDGIICLLPETMHPMTESDILRRLPSARKPIAAYTDESRLIDFSLNTSASHWRAQDIDLAKSFYKASIMNLYDEVKIIKEEVRTINKKQFAIFEFESLMKGDGLTKKAVRKYSYIQYTLHDDQTLVFGFNSPLQLKDKWHGKVEQIMNSIKIK